MSMVYGKGLYGQVDRIPGLCYVSTAFWYAQYIPLFPVRSYIVMEGTEKEDEFTGRTIPLKPKSVVIGYLRGWLGATALFSSGVAGAAITSFIFGHKDAWAIIVTFAVVAICALWVIFYVLSTRRRLHVLLQSAFHLTACLIILGYVIFVASDPASLQAKSHELRYWPALPIANGAIFCYSLTRLWTNASDKRARELAKEIALPTEKISLGDEKHAIHFPTS